MSKTKSLSLSLMFLLIAVFVSGALVVNLKTVNAASTKTLGTNFHVSQLA
jgi:hypothetical protein